MKKLVALLLTLAMLLSVAPLAMADSAAPVNLVWWMGCTSEAPMDWPEVEAKLNEISAKEIGVTCTFKYMTADQVALAMSSGEYYDICFTCDWWNDFATNVFDDMFLDITDLVGEYCPELVAAMPANVWDGAYVNDRLYAVPHMKDYGIEVFWILDTEYFINEKGMEMDNYISFDEIEPYLEMYKADYPDDYPLKLAKGGVTSWLNFMDWIYQDGLVSLSYADQGTDKETTVQFALEMEELVNRMRTIHSWYEKGYINPDAAVTDSMGRSVAGVVQSGQGWFGAETVWSNARQKASYIARYDGPFLSTYSLRGSMTAVSASTPYSAEALKLINLMNTNEEYRTLARYGIQDKHYTKNDDGTVTRTDLGNTNMSLWAYTQGSYIVGPIEASPFESVPADPDMWQKVWAGYSEAITSAAIGFTFDYTPVADQVMAVQAIWQEHSAELATGTVDPDEALPDIIAEMEAAGVRDIVNEAQTQLDAFLAAKE